MNTAEPSSNNDAEYQKIILDMIENGLIQDKSTK